eukprot:TRINITY_DN14617_c0_g1_i1.p1 TRINITY_DN14617_c0_g1~~TRINITY_DN14617_c0_g1_i1.p1  ORF type:complete len:388 (-),score=58.90 TRINITY_DN14617_c0_g1_i1:72-1235(-)
MSHPVCPSLHMSTSYAWDGKRTNIRYTRMRGENREELCKEIAQLYDRDRCVVFPSGIAAIAAVVVGVADKGHVVLADEVYCDTPRIFKYHDCPVSRVDFRRLDELEKALKPNTTLVMYESCSNPTGQVPDYEAVAAVVRVKSPEAKIVIDNSWLSPVLFKPKREICDLIVESTSKYFGGGKVIGGIVVGDEIRIRPVSEYAIVHGQHVSPFDMWTLQNSLETLELRVVAASKATQKVVAHFQAVYQQQQEQQGQKEKQEQRGYVLERVHYPSAATIAENFTDGMGPAVFAMEIPRVKAADFTRYATTEGKLGSSLSFATSYGKSTTLLDCYPTEIAERNTLMIRLALGWKTDTDAVIRDLETLLRDLSKNQSKTTTSQRPQAVNKRK